MSVDGLVGLVITWLVGVCGSLPGSSGVTPGEFTGKAKTFDALIATVVAIFVAPGIDEIGGTSFLKSPIRRFFASCERLALRLHGK